VATKSLKPLPRIIYPDLSPKVVDVLDSIRFGPLRESDDHGEFCWFIREYPRVYRHHVDHAEHRLRSIQAAYEVLHDEAAHKIRNRTARTQSRMTRGGAGPVDTYAIYWDFESFLSATCSALDVLARVAGTAFKQDTAPNFNRFCKSAPDSPISRAFKDAQSRWVLRAKAYRDCFVHFTSVDTMLVASLREYADCWEVRVRIPTNPEAREILGFRYSRRVELLTYAAHVWRQLHALDRRVARILRESYKAGGYPARTERLFALGSRSRPVELADGAIAR
jgi:hypothetical protein